MDLDPDIPEVFNREYEIDDSLDQSSPSLMELVEQIITHPLILAYVKGRARRFVVTRFSGLPDHRQLAMKSTVGKLALILGVVMLHGCGSSGADILTPSALEVENEAADVSVATFTTLGKPTKVVEGAWSKKEIYDPVRDPQVQEIFRKWYTEDQYSMLEYQESHPDEYEIILKSRDIHILDLKRLGCRDVFRGRGRGYGGSGLWVVNDGHFGSEVQAAINGHITLEYMRGECLGDENFGSLKLSVCEANDIRDAKIDVRPNPLAGTAYGGGSRWYEEFNGPSGNPLSLKYQDLSLPWYIWKDNNWDYRIVGKNGLVPFDEMVERYVSSTCEYWSGDTLPELERSDFYIGGIHPDSERRIQVYKNAYREDSKRVTETPK